MDTRICIQNIPQYHHSLPVYFAQKCELVLDITGFKGCMHQHNVGWTSFNWGALKN
jgi:hypothetical protein